MVPDRFFSVMMVVILLHHLMVTTVFAGFGFGSDELGKSGLDFANGYDVNTVTTVSGRMGSNPQPGEKEQVFAEIKVGNETINLSLGPKNVWERKGVPLRTGDDITVKGSKAQGKDGKTYLLVEKLTNRTTGAQVVLRNERGGPAWIGRNASGAMSDSPSGGMMQGGGMSRGGGMMRR
ncbi:DNA-binding protein [Geobacter argillaceus]|uniref:Magnetosome protein MamS/MamX domain-containing protein n=1 Tax=Geobacter argillaceus TaxID=345631 RepID=A0A562VPQ5_9BACT|nr:DNA-binding protein [Geobacter argillaceus]TWJ19761.1 hypothetical protein JN12_01562 [Geobacter argillaceus]